MGCEVSSPYHTLYMGYIISILITGSLEDHGCAADAVMLRERWGVIVTFCSTVWLGWMVPAV